MTDEEIRNESLTMIKIRVLTCVVATIVAPIFPLLGLVLLGAFLVPLTGYGLAFTPLGLALVLGFFPWVFLLFFFWLRAQVHNEARHVKIVGLERALWSVSNNVFGDILTDNIVFLRESVVPGPYPLAFRNDFWVESSVTYGRVILFVDSWLQAAGSTPFALSVALLSWFWLSFRLLVRAAKYWILSLALLFFVVAVSPSEVVMSIWWALLTVLFYMTPPGFVHLRLRLEWARVWCLSLVLDMALLLVSIDHDVKRHYSERLAGRRRAVGAIFRTTVMRSVRFISAVRLPAFVRNRFQSVEGRPELERGRQILKDLGWPVNVDIVERSPSHGLEGHPEFKSWKVADTDFATGLRQMKLHCRESLDELLEIAPSWYRTEEYRTTRNELEATARYFHERPVDFNVDIFDDVWTVVRPIFANSRLTTFYNVIKLWEKKYALGFWMTTPDGRRKMSRKSFIAKVGMPVFRQLWARTFVRASEILPVAHVSVKDEALSPAKYLADRVRSIIGSPISHYIGSTVFAHAPNHNFQFEATPIKVGMPLNGHWLGKVFEKHARFNRHFEGDFFQFDSTVEGPVKQIIKAVRKRGFAAHQDSRGIADLIDVMYDQLDHQLLGHTSTGTVFKKGSGLSTGHSSTTADNSLACIIFYIAAWKSITGLGAREFLHFNELSVYGDDHMLSRAAGAPQSWNPKNIIHVMSKWGVTNKLEEKKLRDMTFLGKHNGPVTPVIQRELAEAGVKGLRTAIWHDKARLVGKLTTKIKRAEPTYRAQRLLSYLSLTAHHPEVYDAIYKVLQAPELKSALQGSSLGIPSYQRVLRNWYSPTEPNTSFVEEDPETQWVNDGRLVVAGTPSLFDHILQALSVVPDLLNPALFNFGPSRALMQLLSSHLSWIPTLILVSNGEKSLGSLDYLLKRTPYAFIDLDMVQPLRVQPSLTTLLTRHWIFMLYLRLKPRYKGFSLANFTIRKAADLAFLAKAQILVDLPRDFFPFDEILLAAILDIVVAPVNVFGFLEHISMPDVAAWLELAWNRVLSTIWSSVPASFNEVDALVKKLDRDSNTLLIQAGTGTGKSTTMLAHLVISQARPFRKLVVIEPRTILALGLSKYVGEAFGVYSTASTTGSSFDPKAKLWYMTPQSFLHALHLISPLDLFVVDEAHLDEPMMVLVASLLKRWRLPTILATATPSKANLESVDYSVEVPIAKVFTTKQVTEKAKGVDGYIQAAIEYANMLPPHVKVAVLLDTPEQVDQAVAASRREAQPLSSKHNPVLLDVPRYFSTNVIDVGITIPGLDVIISPDWEYGGQSQRYTLRDSTLRQRAGRVGRTNNGTFVLFEVSDVVRTTKPASSSAASWKEAIASGVSPMLAWSQDPAAVEEIFGLQEVSDVQRQHLAATAHVFMSNLALFKAREMNMDLASAPTGQEAVLFPTSYQDIGRFSSAAPQDIPAFFKEVWGYLGWLLERKLEATRPDFDEDRMFDLEDEFDNKFRPLSKFFSGVKVPIFNLVNSICESITDNEENPEFRRFGEMGFLDEINEMKQILSRLKDFEDGKEPST